VSKSSSTTIPRDRDAHMRQARHVALNGGYAVCITRQHASPCYF
jgi:hypothetical protein